jgi:hypothetical protein
VSSSTIVTVPLTVQKQENSEWCWAAVTVSVDLFFRPASTHTQCEVAGGVLGLSCCSGGKLSKSDPCNVPHPIHTVLGRFHLLAADPIRKPLTFNQVQKEIDGGRPVCVLIKWRDDDGTVSNRGHFIAINGYRVTPSLKQFVAITDPFFGPSEIDYAIFTSAGGGYRDGRGVWFASFLVDNEAS